MRRIRLPSLIWRTATPVLILCLLGSDPKLDFWSSTARADCVYPANPSFGNVRVTTFTYDLDGHQTQVNSPEGVINYSYDLATGRHILTCTTNSEIAYRHDELGRLWTISVNKRNGTNLLSPEVITNTYTKVGNLSTVTRPNGVLSTYLYDTLNRLTNLTHTATNTLIASYSYQLHATGRRTNAVEILKTEDPGTPYITNTLSWAYDQMYRLTNEVCICSSGAGSYTNRYQYDMVGNRLAKINVTGSGTSTTTNLFDMNDRLLEEVARSGGSITESNAYAYDDNGSLTAKAHTVGATTTTATYSYDLKNKLTAFSDGSISATYAYNHQGIRVRSMVGSSTTLYLIDANNHTGYQQILDELSASGATATRSYVIGHDVLGQTSGSVVSWLLYDGHGSTRQLADSAGTVSQRFNFDAYGVTQTGTSSGSPATSLLYCGEQFDPSLQWYSLRARFYSPGNGSFNSMDSFNGENQDPMSLHRYLYCSAEPVNQADPSGHFIDTISTLFSSALNFFMSTRDAQRVEAGRQEAVAGIGLVFLLITMNIVLTHELGVFDSDDQMEMIKLQTQRRVNPVGSPYAYVYERCVEFADDAMQYFTKRKMHPQRIIYRSFNRTTVGDNISAVEGFGYFGCRLNKNVSTSGMHQGVLVDGTVYDNNVPFGVPRDMWENGYEVTILGTTREVTLRQADDMMIGKIRVGEDK